MTTHLTLATWNINSVRARLDSVERFTQEVKPDILCLQETKCDNGSFPEKAIKAMGYQHLAINGQKAYHGVATFSRLPIVSQSVEYVAGNEEARHLFCEVEWNGKPLGVHNFYVPAGGDEPDVEKNPKFAAKLEYLADMKRFLKADQDQGRRIIVGDLNIAPYEQDVWGHKQLLKVVSHTPVETQGLEDLREDGGWVDVMRHFVPLDQPLFSWWSYRAKDWRASNKGRRLDHVWCTPDLIGEFDAMQVYDDARGWTKASDHAPVVTKLKV